MDREKNIEESKEEDKNNTKEEEVNNKSEIENKDKKVEDTEDKDPGITHAESHTYSSDESSKENTSQQNDKPKRNEDDNEQDIYRDLSPTTRSHLKFLEKIPSFKNPRRDSRGRFKSFFITSDELQTALSNSLEDFDFSLH